MDNRFDGCLTTSASGRCVGSKISFTFFNGRSQNGGLVSLNFGSPFAPTTLSFTFTSFPPFFVVILWLVFVFAASSAAAIFVNVIAASTAIIRIDITFAIAIPIAITSSAPIIAGHRAAKGWRPIATRPEATPTIAASEAFVAETSAASKTSSAASASSTSSIPWGIPIISVKYYFDLLVCKVYVPFQKPPKKQAEHR